MKRRLQLLTIFAACMIASFVSGLWMLGCILVGSPRAWNLALAYDRVMNVASGGDGRETVSSRAGRAQLVNRRWGCVLCKLLDLVDHGHCLRNILPEFMSPEEYVVFYLKSLGKSSD